MAITFGFKCVVILMLVAETLARPRGLSTGFLWVRLKPDYLAGDFAAVEGVESFVHLIQFDLAALEQLHGQESGAVEIDEAGNVALRHARTHVAAEQLTLLGDEGHGFVDAMQLLDAGRIGMRLENFADEFSAIISRQLDERV